MWHKAEWMGHPMRLELTRVGLLVKLANHYTTLACLATMSGFITDLIKLPSEKVSLLVIYISIMQPNKSIELFISF